MHGSSFHIRNEIKYTRPLDAFSKSDQNMPEKLIFTSVALLLIECHYHSIYTSCMKLRIHSTSQQVQKLANVFRSEDSDKIWGVIGPGDPTEAEFLAPIFHREDLITVIILLQ